MSTQVLIADHSSDEVIDIYKLFSLVDSLINLSDFADDEPELEVSDALLYLKDTACKCEN